MLTTASRSRNPRLAEAISKLGLGETAGMGVDRLYAAMAQLGHQPPQFAADQATVRVALIGGAPNTQVTRFVQSLPDGTINARMVRLVLEADASTTSRILGDMVERGLLVKTSTAERGPSVTYGPGPRMSTPRMRRATRTTTRPDPTLFEGGRRMTEPRASRSGVS